MTRQTPKRHVRGVFCVVLGFDMSRVANCDTMGRTASHGWPAAVLKAYAASIGATVRTAQRHAEQNTDDFQRFARGMAGEGVARQAPAPVPPVTVESATLGPPDAPDVVEKEDKELPETGRMLKAAWLMWSEHYRQWHACRGGYKDRMGNIVPTDHPMMLMHAKIIMELRKAYNDAFAKHQAWQIDARRLIPVNEFHAFRSEFLLPVTSLMRNSPPELAPLVNPGNQGQAIAGAQQWLTSRFMPAVERMLEGLAALAPGLKAA